MQPNLMHHPARLAGASLLRLQSDDRLVSLAREGHDPAYTAIVDRYRAPLLRYCSRLLGQGRAEDAVQQAFVNAHHAMKSTEKDIQLRPWLYRIAHNASLNILRADHDHAQLDPERAGSAGVEDAVELRDRLHETLTAIQALPSAQRDALLLRELEGRSHVEIAAALGVTAGSARQHLMRARASLRTAVTAITPYPLLIKLASAMTSDPVTGRVTEAMAGAGIVATVAKVSAGVLATGAIAGAIAGGELPVPGVTRHHVSTEHRADATTPPRSLSTHAAPTLTAIDDRGGARETFLRPGGRGSSDHSKQGDGHSGHGTSGEGHGGSGSSGTSGGSDDSGTSGTSGDDHSGTSGSDGSGTSGTSGGDGSGTSGTSGGDHSGTPGGSGDPAADEHGGQGSPGSGDLLDSSGSGGSGSSGSGSPATTTTTGSDDGHSGSGSADGSGSGSGSGPGPGDGDDTTTVPSTGG